MGDEKRGVFYPYTPTEIGVKLLGCWVAGVVKPTCASPPPTHTGPMHCNVALHDRETLLGQQSLVVWLYGLSGAGKSTLASRLIDDLHSAGLLTSSLDGDVLRTGLTRGLGFSPDDRTENLRRAAEAASLIADTGAIVVCSFITPLCEHRQMVRDIVGAGRFFDVYVRCPFEVCASRDVKGLYQRPPPNFTGRDSLFEEPVEPASLTIDTNLVTVDAAALTMLSATLSRGTVHLSSP